MKRKPILFVALALGFGVFLLWAQGVEDYIKKAGEFERAGNIDRAIETMTRALEKYPDSPTVHSYLGLYQGMKAGKTENYMEAFQMVNESFGLLDRAVSLAPDQPLPRLHRGLMGVNIPEFLGKLDQGIRDLEMLKRWSEDPGRQIPSAIRNPGYQFLAQGYQKKKKFQKAIELWKKLIGLNPGEETVRKAEAEIEKLEALTQPQRPAEEQMDSPRISRLKEALKKNPDNTSLLVELGQVYMDLENHGEARHVLKRVIERDPKNIQAHKDLAVALGELASRGYDQRVYLDQNYRTNLAFELYAVLDRACQLAPEDIELRLRRGIAGVEMPFFVKKLDQGIADLNWVLKRDGPYETKATAHYWLGRAFQKKAMGYWIRVVSDFSKSQASREVFSQLYPRIARLDKSHIQRPAVAIDFIIGFQDQLPPQTAVWIETSRGDFVKTIYVSGFSGYAKERQVNLSSWSEASGFVDVDGVTGASIDLGHHIYLWDLENHRGEPVGPGGYVVKVEVAFWPSMEYQMVSIPITVGTGDTVSVKKEGRLIPYVKVKLYSDKKE